MFIEQETKTGLDEIKMVPQETYNNVISRLLIINKKYLEENN